MTMNSHVALIESIGRLGLALVLGSMIGIERQWHQKMVREGINVHGLNTAATLWCSAIVGTFAGGGYWIPSMVAAGFVVGTNICLRPLIRRVNSRMGISTNTETYYTVTLTCRSIEEAHLRSLLLHALSQSCLGLRRMDSADVPDVESCRHGAGSCTQAH
jgi:uncharacterized membrane protein YhiD involved in acid resistance